MFNDDLIELKIEQEAETFLRTEIAKAESSDRRRILEKFVSAALGSIPWIGGFLSAVASYTAEQGTHRTDGLLKQWLEEHAKKIQELRMTLFTVKNRFDQLGSAVDARIESEEYLELVRDAFKVWDDAATDEKRRYVANVLTNAAGTRLCSDDVLRLFLDWLDYYHESHFAVIREISKDPGITRYLIWSNVYGELPREDSAEADLYRLLIRDLSTGGVIRQDRETNPQGQFMRRRNPRSKAAATGTMESAFEDQKPYVLTELGKQFVHYTMNEVVQRIGAAGA